MDIPGTHVFSRNRLIAVALALTVAAVVAALAVRPELAAGTVSPDQPGLAGAGVAGFGTTNPPNTEIIFPRKKIVTKRRVAKVRFSYGCVTDDSLGENTCDFFECALDGGAWRRCPGGASDPGADEEVTYRIKATQSVTPYAFAVRVTDTAGKTDPTPAVWLFTVRRYGPIDAFSGVWKARDLDGSRQRVRFSGRGNRRTLKYRDSSSSACPGKGPERLTGKGRIKGKRLIGHWRAGRCTKSGEKLGGAGKLRFRWRRSTNTLKNNWGSVWKRKR